MGRAGVVGGRIGRAALVQPPVSLQIRYDRKNGASQVGSDLLLGSLHLPEANLVDVTREEYDGAPRSNVTLAELELHVILERPRSRFCVADRPPVGVSRSRAPSQGAP